MAVQGSACASLSMESTALPNDENGKDEQRGQLKRRRMTAAQTACCRTCRLRKVKCGGATEGGGPCGNCARLHLTCGFVSARETISRTTPSRSHTEAGTLRKRAQRACSQCHSHKTKCSGGVPKCKRCEAAGLICEYTPARRKFANVGLSSSSKADAPLQAPSSQASSSSLSSSSALLMAEELLIRKDIVLRHFDAYMRYLYWVPCLGFMHPEMTYQAIQKGAMPPVQGAALCALCSFFVNPGPAAREFGNKYSAMVEAYLCQNIARFSEDALMLLALNVLFHLIDRSFAKVWQWFGMASRLMIGLQLNWDVPSDAGFVKQETLRRIVWQLFSLDRLLAGGYEEYVCCRAENMRIRLPCNEAAFRGNRPVVAERLHDAFGKTSTIGLHGVQIRLIDLRHRIQVVTKKLAAPHGVNMANLESSKVMTDINALQNELTRLHASIPDDLRLSDQSIASYARSEAWLGYVYFHTHMAACHMELYAFSLPGHRDPAAIEILRRLPEEFLARSQKQAVAHALCLARFLDAIRAETDKMPHREGPHLVGDFSVTYMATQCIQILLIALQFNLYQDLADHTTAPLWRGGATDEGKIRGLIGMILEISEPWTRVIEATRETYESSRIAVEYFDKTRRVVDRSHPDTIPLYKPAASPWMMHHGPPGVPHFLAQARGSPFYILDLAGEAGEANWTCAELDGMMASAQVPGDVLPDGFYGLDGFQFT